jgi:4-carboxymuconolactone decarboxylase
MRLERLLPGSLIVEQRALYDSVVGGPRGRDAVNSPIVDDDGALQGPFNAMLFHPASGRAIEQLGAALRYQGTLPPRARELAILVVAAGRRSEYEWYAHVRISRRAGVHDREIAAIDAGEVPALEDRVERTAVEVTRALVTDGDLDDDAYASAVAALGSATMVELTTLVGYYSMLALQLRVFRVAAPADGAG